VVTLLAPFGDDRGGRIVAVADHVNGIGVEELTHLLDDGGEDLLRPRPAGHEGRHPTQRGLLFGQATEFRSSIGVRDGGRGQIREVRDT
jgi:hypothetical protein